MLLELLAINQFGGVVIGPPGRARIFVQESLDAWLGDSLFLSSTAEAR